MMHGAAAAASLNRARIRAAPRPTKSSTKSEPERHARLTSPQSPSLSEERPHRRAARSHG
eukprot:5143590-Prymnesium_polylepis.1